MPEWPKGHDWKSCVGPKSLTVGSNPTLSAIESSSFGPGRRPCATGGCKPRQVRKEATVSTTLCVPQCSAARAIAMT